ncbi:hypothetical protein M2301_002932 [Micromonospora sp. 1209]|nr:hypothetical protein [Micromonospora sp. 1209]
MKLSEVCRMHITHALLHDVANLACDHFLPRQRLTDYL